MYSLRLFSKLSSPRKLAYGPAAISDSNGLMMTSSETSMNVEEEDLNVEVLPGAKGSSSSLQVTRSASSPDLLLNNDTVAKVVTAHLSPEVNKMHQYHRSNSCIITVDSTSASNAKSSKRIQQHQNPVAEIPATVGSITPVATETLMSITTSPTPGSSGAGVKSKRKPAGKLSWQPRTQPSTPTPATTSTRGHHRRSPSLISTPTMISNLDGMSPPDSSTATVLMPKTLRQSASFSGFSSKERWHHGGRSSATPKAGLGDTTTTTTTTNNNNNNNNNVYVVSSGSTPRNASTPGSGGRPPVNNNIGNLGGLNGSAISVTSVVNGNGNGGTPARSTSRALRYGSGAPKVPSPVQQQPESRFELEEDPSFSQDRNVQVLIRSRPISSAEIAQQGHARCVKQESAHTVSWLGQPETRFTFDHVAGESVTQEELFRVAGLPMVENCIAGYNSCMFAYGQTGSGKTHTMLGDIADLDFQPSDNRGMTPRVFESLFAKIQVEEEARGSENLKYKCRCSFLEIYNEQVADLLEPSSNLQMREDVNKGVYVEGLLEVEVQNVQDVLHLLLLGAANRKVAATNMNRESSRSHSVFTCIIESQWESDSMMSFRTGRLNLVDLAGSERQKASGAEGDRLKEAASINKSLSTLGLVITALVEIANGKQRHVPYRDSKLTFLLQDSLGGNSKTTIIANISPSSCTAAETLSTLKFAKRAKFIQNNAVINEDASGDVNGLRQQIQLLKDELARLRRQSISRVPTVRASGTIQEGSMKDDISNAKNLHEPTSLSNSTEGCFLHFGRALLSPTILNNKIKSLEVLLAGALRREQMAEISSKRSTSEIDHLKRLVKQREDEAECNKQVLRFREDKIRRLEMLSAGLLSTDTFNHEDTNASLQESQLIQDHKGGDSKLTNFALENIQLQEQLCRYKDFDIGGEREAMAQEISSLRDQLAEVLEGKLPLETCSQLQEKHSWKEGIERNPLIRLVSGLEKRDASSADFAAQAQKLEFLQAEVELYQRGLEECRTYLSTCLESNERYTREVDSYKLQLDNVNEELATLREKVPTTGSLELKLAQNQEVIVDLESRLLKSEDRAEQEASRCRQVECQLKEALQESTNLQTELQWTKDSLDAAEALVETLQQDDAPSDLGASQRLQESRLHQAYVIEQLQSEITELRSSIEDWCVRGQGLEEQISAGDNDNNNNNVRTQKFRFSAGHERVRHHDAILQLQMELDSIDGTPESAIKSFRWERGTRDLDDDEEADIDNVEVKITTSMMQLELESVESTLEEERRRLKEIESSSLSLQAELDETLSKLFAEKEVVTSLELELKLLRAEQGSRATVQQDWEGVASSLIEHLASGKLSSYAGLTEQSVMETTFLEGFEELEAVESVRNVLHAISSAAGSSIKLNQGIPHEEDSSWEVLEPQMNLMKMESVNKIEWRSAITCIILWWHCELARLRRTAKKRMKDLMDHAVSKMQARKGILFSLEAECEDQMVESLELKFREEEENLILAEKAKFEMEAYRSATLLEDLHLELSAVETQLRLVESKAVQVAKAQAGLAVAKDTWQLEKLSLASAAGDAQKLYTDVKEEVSESQEELRRLEVRESERFKREEELKKHLGAVQILANALQNQIVMKEDQILKLKEQMAEQHEEWVLERSDLLVANREAEARCIEKNRIITTMQVKVSRLESHLLQPPAAHNYGEMMDSSDQVKEISLPEVTESMDRLTAENLELQKERQSLSNDVEVAKALIAKKEDDLITSQKRLVNAESQLKHTEEKLEALMLLMADFASSEENVLREKQFLRAEVERLQSSMEVVVKHVPKDNLDATKKQIKANGELELAKAVAALAASEEKVKLLTEMVAKMREDWTVERDWLILEKDEMQFELSRWLQHVDVQRSSDRPPLQIVDENRLDVAATPDSNANSKQADNNKKAVWQVVKLRSEIANLRSEVREKDHVIMSARVELSSTLAEHKKLEAEVKSLVMEKDQMLQVEKVSLRSQLLQEEPVNHLRNCESELERLTMLLLETEEQRNKEEQEWKQEKAQLEMKREEAELAASRKTEEAAAVMAKLKDWQTTLQEADLLVKCLTRANEMGKKQMKETERLASIHEQESKQTIVELMEAVALIKEQIDQTMAQTEAEIRAIVAETHLFKTELLHEFLSLMKTERASSIEDMRSSSTMMMAPSVKCLDYERRSWEQQFRAATTVLTEKESAIRNLQEELEKARRQTAIAQTAQHETMLVLQEKEEIVMKLLNELNHLNQSVSLNRSLRLSVASVESDNYSSLRRSYSCKLIEEKETTLSVLKEEQECLKTMVFNLETENGELQQEVLEAEDKATALESNVAALEREIKEINEMKGEAIRLLTEQLKESIQHINELECPRVELRDEMQQQAVRFAELYAELQKQETILGGEGTLTSTEEENKNSHVKQTLEEENAKLKSMVKQMDTELTEYKMKVGISKTSQSDLRHLRLELASIQQEVQGSSEEKARFEGELQQKSLQVEQMDQELKSARAEVEELQEKTCVIEKEMLRKQSAIEALQGNLVNVEKSMLRCLEEATIDMKDLESERDKLQSELNLLIEQLEEKDSIASKAQQIAEANKNHAQEKQVEVDILSRSVEELERTVFALESQLGILKREIEEQHLIREDMEMELQGLKNQMVLMQAAFDEASAWGEDKILEAVSGRNEAQRRLEAKEAELQLMSKKLEGFQFESEENTKEKQKPKPVEYDHKIKALDLTLEGISSTLQKVPKLKGAGATFNCINMAQQVHSELNQERQSYESCIRELETALANSQKEVCMLNEKLSDAERMTCDVLRDLLGVKIDMTNVATLLSQQGDGDAVKSQKPALEKDEAVEHLLMQLNEFIEERESWLEQICQRQDDLSAAQDAMDKLLERKQTLIAENTKLRSENRMQKKRISELEQEIKKLSGQQNLQQRIKHHIKIKDENNMLKTQNGDLTAKLRRAELLYARVSDELAKYRVADGKAPVLNFDEEQRLHKKLQDAEEQNIQLAQKLVTMCTSVMKAAGVPSAESIMEPALALEALQQMKYRLERIQLELEGFKLKMKISGEKQRLSELRTTHSPMKGMVADFNAQCLTPR